jgi:hypothetical protein
MIRFKAILILISFAIVSACSLNTTPTPTNTPQPTITPTPTLVPSEDYDGDTLSNIDELEKYHTNPYSLDSDGDGISDGDWEERREYVYSVRVLVKIKQPFDIEAMNDSFQDTRVIADEDSKGYTSLEIIIYPETSLSLIPSPYPLQGLSPDLIELTKPGTSTNYSEEMHEHVLLITEKAVTDYEAVKRVLNWFNTNTELVDFPFQPEVFYYAYIDNDKVKLRNYPSLPVNEMLEKCLFADSMFRNRVHGTCCSTATLKCAMIKASGIPCKIINTLDPIFSHEDQKENYINNLNRIWQGRFENQPSGKPSWCANHCFMEVYLGNRWVRVDRSINIYSQEYLSLNFKIISVSDLTDIDFSKTYPVNWINNRPYYTLLIEDQEPVNFKID